MIKIFEKLTISVLISLITLFAKVSFAQYRPPLFFREDFKENAAATPITQAHVANPDLILGLYGPGADSIRKSHHDRPADDPYYVWSGECKRKLGRYAEK